LRSSSSACRAWRGTGNLTDCRKLYFDVARDVTPRFRIIYRLTPSEADAKTVEVLAVGLKTEHRNISAEYIYTVVGKRLGRL
jgi:mRNA interferase RelE/StbE